MRVNERKGRQPRNYPGTPRCCFTPRSELHRFKFCGEAHTALRGWRPISAALSSPVPLLFVRGRKTSLINHWASRPIYNRRSIRESMGIVNSIPSKNISTGLAMPLPVKNLIATATAASQALHPPCFARSGLSSGTAQTGDRICPVTKNFPVSVCWKACYSTPRASRVRGRSLSSAKPSAPRRPGLHFSIAHHAFLSPFTAWVKATKLIAPRSREPE
jgi:hypothetical protein